MADELSVKLHFKGGSSDKVYELELKAAVGNPGRYVVNFAYGRTGSTLKTGTKTDAPVDYVQASNIYDAVLREKTGKGYKVISDKTTSFTAPAAPLATPDWLPQLLNPIDEARAAYRITDPQWGMQEKHNGENRILGFLGAVGFARNKLGKAIPLADPIANTLFEIGRKHNVVFGGEAINDRLVMIHDLLYLDGDLQNQPYTDRYDLLAGLFEDLWVLHLTYDETAPYANFRLSPLWVTDADKYYWYHHLKDNNREGVVFKRLDGIHVPGRPASNGDWLKLKFWESTGCIVIGHNAKRSVQLGMLDDRGGLHDVGNCAVPSNYPLPAVNSIVEIKYLYIIAPGGALVQPAYLGLKDAGRREDCRLDTLKIASK